MEKTNNFTKKLQVVLDRAVELEADPVIMEENCMKISPKCEEDLEILQNIASKEGVKLHVNNGFLSQLAESKQELNQLRMVLSLGSVSYDVVGINKKSLKYQVIIFPDNVETQDILKRDVKNFEKLEVTFEMGAVQVIDERELGEDSEISKQLKQRDSATEAFFSWGIYYEIVDCDTIEIFPTSEQQKREIQRQLGKYDLLTFVFKRDNYTKVPMSNTEKREIIKDLAAKFKKYGNGFIEMSNPYKIIAYAKSKKIGDVYEKIFSDYWYRYVEVEGELKSLQLVVKQLYENGELFTIDEWNRIKQKAQRQAETLDNVHLRVDVKGQIVIQANDFQSVKSLYWLKNYHDRKLESDNERGYLYTSIYFQLNE